MGLVKKRVALHMKDNTPTIEGLLVGQSRREFVLISAEILQDTETTHQLGGHVRVPRENVYCVQELAR